MDYFRINLSLNDCPTATPPGTKDPQGNPWVDVTDWQNFLVNNGNLTNPPYPTGNFDMPTQIATHQFQNAAHAAGHLPTFKIGYVDQATYNAAVNYYQMTPCQLVPHG